MTRVGDLGERRLVDRMAGLIGGQPAMLDDAAVVEFSGDLVLSTDRVWERTHLPEGAGYRRFGHYALAVNLSDLAAMGASPVGCLVALGLPRSMGSADLDSFMEGFLQCSTDHGCPVLGGDTKEGDSLSAAVTVLGRTESPLYRRGAEPGMGVYLGSGVTGLSGACLELLGSVHDADPEKLYDGVLGVEPRIAGGLALSHLAAGGAKVCCMDTSDGLARSLHWLSGLNRIGIRIATGAANGLAEELGAHLRNMGFDTLRLDLPEHVLHSGGDFQLLAISDHDLGAAGFTRIGECFEGTGVFLGHDPMDDRGYEHHV